MTAADTHPAASQRLAHYPVTFFAIGMGMMGATLAIRAAERAFAFTHTASTAALILSVAMFAMVTIGYAAKAVLHWPEVRAEWHHPVWIAFSRPSRSRFFCWPRPCWNPCRKWPMRSGWWAPHCKARWRWR